MEFTFIHIVLSRAKLLWDDFCFEINLAYISINLGKTQLQTALVKQTIFCMTQRVLERDNDDSRIRNQPVSECRHLYRIRFRR